LHVSLQSGSTSVLERMRRGYTRDDYLAMVERAASAIADLVLSTDLMVGFPGETDEEFADSLDLIESLDVIERVGFSKVHVFPFSPRPGTAAAELAGHIEKAVIDERLGRVAEVAEAAARRCRERFVGRTMAILVEGKTREGRTVHGFTPNYLKTLVETDRVQIGALLPVRITSYDALRLYGCEETGP
jgi:tRNA A37 methylthiotransferase MiaB